MLAVAAIGAIILPMDVRWTTEEKRRLAGHFGAHLVLVPDGDQAPDGIRTVALDAAWRRGVETFAGEVAFVRRREQPLLLSLSSGTTGTPKGPLVTHGHTLSRLFIYTVSLTFNDADRFITATPLYFGGARYMTLAYLFMGATVVIFPAPYKPEELARAVNEMNITALFLVPTLLRRLLEMPKPSRPLLPGVRLLISSGSSLYRILPGAHPATAPSPRERTALRGGKPARHRRLGIILRHPLHRLGDLPVAEELDQLERFVQAGRDPAARDPVAIDDEARVPLDHLHLGKLLEAGNEGPMGGGLVSVEQAGRGQEERALAHRRHVPGLPGMTYQEIEIGPARIAHQRLECARIPARNPQHVERLHVRKARAHLEGEAVARGDMARPLRDDLHVGR
jgi:hypothetical protein